MHDNSERAPEHGPSTVAVISYGVSSLRGPLRENELLAAVEVDMEFVVQVCNRKRTRPCAVYEDALKGTLALYPPMSATPGVEYQPVVRRTEADVQENPRLGRCTHDVHRGVVCVGGVDRSRPKD